ncbi:uncharacterized protein LY89DRAFT_396698 [Mollisia scopiformis]|uniref:MARVEL domain-containing protein n=1 Tax=Mollisia scopiformis TaxID=149040 RepID=A0A132B525_MOLSC|nr:uncharacterized protein LY89DRAFT_396698 [Mollisia scopiformis]KUJ06777.1 hypothetical protein LY89DRAFT_396698 [Mollisia scopiformis]
MPSQQRFLLLAQLFLRAVSVLLSLAAISLGVAFVALGQPAQVVVFALSSATFLISSMELRVLLLHFAGLPTPRFPPAMFVACDVIAVLSAVGAGGALIAQGVGPLEGVRYGEIWVVVLLVIVHFFCLLFDSFEYCAWRARLREERDDNHDPYF